MKGMVQFCKECSVSPYWIEGGIVKIDKWNTWKINIRLTCSTFYSLYLIECEKYSCKERYIGKTKKILEIGLPITGVILSIIIMTKPLGHILTYQDNPWPKHFFKILEQLKINGGKYRKEKEKDLINKFTNSRKAWPYKSNLYQGSGYDI